MKEEQDISGTAQPKEGSKISNYVRTALQIIFVLCLLAFMVFAWIKKHAA